MKIIACSGSYDPPTNGHLHLFRAAAELGDRVIIYVASNPAKKTLLAPKERLNIIQSIIKAEGFEHVDVKIVHNDYVMRDAIKDNVSYMLRGVRNSTDLEYEQALMHGNQRIHPNVKTIFTMTSSTDVLNQVSSSFVKSFIGPVGWPHYVKCYLPKESFCGVQYATIRRYIEDWTGLSAEDFGLDEVYPFYKDESRYYHDVSHLMYLFEMYRAYRQDHGSDCEQDRLMVAAILWHDVVNGKPDSERHSVIYLEDYVKNRTTWLAENVSHVRNIIYATASDVPYEENDMTHLFVELDLSILGAHEDIYEQYEMDVRAEYASYPNDIYYDARQNIMSALYKSIKGGKFFTDPWWSDVRHRIDINMERYHYA